MDRARALELLEQLHDAQNEYYGGGHHTLLRQILATDIVWTVPGASRIAGTYRGLDEVFAYFRQRRDLAGGTFRMHRRDILVGDTQRLAALTDGTATIAGQDHRWSTVGLYQVNDHDQIAACWLLALDQAAFDAIWSD